MSDENKENNVVGEAELRNIDRNQLVIKRVDNAEEKILEKLQDIEYRLVSISNRDRVRITLDTIIDRHPDYAGALDDKLWETYDEIKADIAKKEEEANKKAERIYNAFMKKHPDAKIHEDTLAEVLERNSTLSPEDAYQTLRKYYDKKGYDWSMSLDEIRKEKAKSRTKSKAKPKARSRAKPKAKPKARGR